MRASRHTFAISLLMFMIFSIGMRGHAREDGLTFDFRLREKSIDTTYLDNRASLSLLRNEFASIDFIDSISVTVSSSPEGSYQFNARLAAERASEVRQLLKTLSSGALTDDRIRITVIDEDWEGLIGMIEENYDGRDKEKIISIINTKGISDATREWRLNRIDDGQTWKLLKTEYCMYLRRASVVRIYRNMPDVGLTQQACLRASTTGSPALRKSLYMPTPPRQKSLPVLTERTPVCEISHSGTRIPGINIFTDLLSDAMLIPNVGAEVHLGKGWALNASWDFAWWDISDKHYFWRTYGGGLGVRKYLKPTEEGRPMSGHHIGLYGQAHTYDFETGNKGQLSDLTYGGGLEYGYTLAAGKNLSLDFSLGIGYLTGEYKTYIPDSGCYVWQATAIRHWFGPTKAEITLAWTIRPKARQKGKGGQL